MKLGEMKRITSQFSFPISAHDQEQLYAHLRALGIDPNNFYQEMEMTSRFVDTHQDISFSNAMVSLHSHSFFEVICCRNTCGAEYLVGSQRYRLQKGDIIFISPGISHRPLLPANMTEPYARDVLWISPEYFEGLISVFPDYAVGRSSNTNLLRTAGTKWEYLSDLFRTGVLESERKGTYWEAAVVANTTTLLIHLRRAILDNSASPMKAEKPELLDRVMAYIQDHLADHITLTETAKHFYVSESTISQTFRKKMGVSFYHCVTQQRLIAAKTLILQGLPLESISEQVGFSDYSTFYRAFKQEYGVSPRQFRKLQEAVEPLLP